VPRMKDNLKGNLSIDLTDVCSSDGSGSKIFDPGRVSHLWFGLEFGKFYLKMSNFSNFYPSGQKNCFGSSRKVPGSEPGQPLIYCGSKVSSGQGPSLVCRLSLRAHTSKSYVLS